MKTRPVPYIGITDFVTGEQTRNILKVMEECQQGKMQPRRLMVGVMMSYKTLHNLPSRWTNVFPPKSEIGPIFIDHPLAFNTLHYADYDGLTDMDSMNQLMSTLAVGAKGRDTRPAIQFDMIWPDKRLLEQAKGMTRGGIQTVLQIGKNALEIEENNPKRVVRRLEGYAHPEAGLVDYVLLDRSMGQGRGMDADVLLPFIRAIAEAFPVLGIAVAGGLGPTTMHLVEPIVQEFPWISIDAQGQLRSSGSALDPIEWDRAEEYLRQASRLFS